MSALALSNCDCLMEITVELAAATAATIAARGLARSLSNAPQFWNLIPCRVDTCVRIFEVYAPQHETTALH